MSDNDNISVIKNILHNVMAGKVTVHLGTAHAALALKIKSIPFNLLQTKQNLCNNPNVNFLCIPVIRGCIR